METTLIACTVIVAVIGLWGMYTMGASARSLYAEQQREKRKRQIHWS